MRLEQALFTQGFGTRRECRSLIAAGEVSFLGRVERDPDLDIDPRGATLVIGGREWPWHARAIIALNKPPGYECSRKPSAHPSVLTLLPAPLRARGVQPVGRLDEDTTGLLVLTDDGGLLHRLTHPRRHVRKVYELTLRHEPDGAFCEKMLSGVLLRGDSEPTAAEECRITGPRSVELTVTSGKYHQVKRMAAAAGNRVDALRRIAFGGLRLPPGLEPGQWMWLESEHVILGDKP